MGFKLVEGKGLREGWDSKELWKSVEKSNTPRAKPARGAPGKGTEEEPKLARLKNQSMRNPISLSDYGPATRLTVRRIDETRTRVESQRWGVGSLLF